MTLTATNAVPGSTVCTYTWTGPNGFTFSGTSDFDGPFIATIPNVTPDASGDYIITISSPNGCTAEPDTVNINVFTNLVITDLTGGGSYCEGDEVTLTASNSVDVESSDLKTNVCFDL